MTHFRRAVQPWWDDGWDLLLTPTLAEPPPPLGTFANDPEQPDGADARAGRFVPFTPPFNMSGQPAISLPLHWTADGLPVGVQLVAAYGREDVLIRVASQLEQAKPWAASHPRTSDPASHAASRRKSAATRRFWRTFASAGAGNCSRRERGLPPAGRLRCRRGRG